LTIEASTMVPKMETGVMLTTLKAVPQMQAVKEVHDKVCPDIFLVWVTKS